MAGTDDSPNSEQSTITKIPSSSHWHGAGHSGAATAAVPCLSWIRPYPHTPEADPQTPSPMQRRSRSTGSMSDCPPACIYTCRDFCLVTLSFVLSGSVDEVRCLQWFLAFPDTPQKPPLLSFSPVQVVLTVNLSLSQALSSSLLFLSHHFIPQG